MFDPEYEIDSPPISPENPTVSRVQFTKDLIDSLKEDLLDLGLKLPLKVRATSSNFVVFTENEVETTINVGDQKDLSLMFVAYALVGSYGSIDSSVNIHFNPYDPSTDQLDEEAELANEFINIDEDINLKDTAELDPAVDTDQVNLQNNDAVDQVEAGDETILEGLELNDFSGTLVSVGKTKETSSVTLGSKYLRNMLRMNGIVSISESDAKPKNLEVSKNESADINAEAGKPESDDDEDDSDNEIAERIEDLEDQLDDDDYDKYIEITEKHFNEASTDEPISDDDSMYEAVAKMSEDAQEALYAELKTVFKDKLESAQYFSHTLIGQTRAKFEADATYTVSSLKLRQRTKAQRLRKRDIRRNQDRAGYMKRSRAAKLRWRTNRSAITRGMKRFRMSSAGKRLSQAVGKLNSQSAD